MGKRIKHTTLKVTTKTMEELRKLRAWLELSTGKRYSIEGTIKEMAIEFNKAVTIPWGEIDKLEKPKVVPQKKERK